MHADFFRQKPSRLTNPTYASNNVLFSFLEPSSKYDIVMKEYSSKIKEKNKIIEQVPARIPYKEPTKTATNQPPAKSSSHIRNKSLVQNKTNNIGTNQVNALIRSKSNLSSYGTTSLAAFPSLSDREVFQKQNSDRYNIINNYPNSYRYSLKMFPKFRNEINEDNPNKIRKAFISGKPELGLQANKAFKQTLSSSKGIDIRTKNPQKI